MKEVNNIYRHFILSINTIIKNKAIITLMIMAPLMSIKDNVSLLMTV